MAAQKKRLVTVTALGVSAKADPSALDDYDLLGVIEEHGLQSRTTFEAIGCALFGTEGWENVKSGLREDGKLTITRVGEFMDAATDQLDALKN